MSLLSKDKERNNFVSGHFSSTNSLTKSCMCPEIHKCPEINFGTLFVNVYVNVYVVSLSERLMSLLSKDKKRKCFVFVLFSTYMYMYTYRAVSLSERLLSLLSKDKNNLKSCHKYVKNIFVKSDAL